MAETRSFVTELSGGSIGSAQKLRGAPSLDPASSLLDNFVLENEGDRPIRRVLVANNGLAGVKFIRSVRSWASQYLGNPKAIFLVAMATPDDIRVNAEHIQLADQYVEVPGGSNANNYANVTLVVQTAVRCGADAVWPGWGHASENPELPDALNAVNIRFLGPPSVAMAALGDKIGSTILAQAAEVPTLPWSGSHVAMSFEECNGVVPEEVYSKACIFSVEQAIDSCNKIGYPMMLKASWGGGGKGIRKVLNDDEVTMVFKQVQSEVPGSPIFGMKLAPMSRHLEVQLLADMHGNVASLYSRDCSVQRRHQKIIEEGPVTAAPPEMLEDMEKSARALARSVGYVGAATVEYLYCIEEKKYYFLELNPRLQVEHPVTEGISGVNIPSCQLMIGMGMPLYRIPQIRALYGQDPNSSEPFDFEAVRKRRPNCHVVAVRITSEDANTGFKPTAGHIDNLVFRPTPEVWGYFSVRSGGGIHEYSDSQFGHLFAHGADRKSAIRNMVVALRELEIRGEIRTITDYVLDMLQTPDFVNNEIHTGWLDARIAASIHAQQPAWELAVIAGATVKAWVHFVSLMNDYRGYLSHGRLPPSDMQFIRYSTSLVIEGNKYNVAVVRRSSNLYCITLNGSSVEVLVRTNRDGGFLIQVDGKLHVVHREEEAMGTRLLIDSQVCQLAKEQDPSKLVSASPGKLIRYLVKDGDHIQKSQPYAEVEVMKMIMPLISSAAGKVTRVLPEGSPLSVGDVIARLELDDLKSVVQAKLFEGTFPEMGPPQLPTDRLDQQYKIVLEAAQAVLQGYVCDVAQVVDDLLFCLNSPALPLAQWQSEYSVVRNRLPAELVSQLVTITMDHEDDLANAAAAEERLGLVLGCDFPSAQLITAMAGAIASAAPADKTTLQASVEGLMQLCKAHEKGLAHYRKSVVRKLIESFLEVESQFRAGSGRTTEQEVIFDLRQAHKNNLQLVVDMVMSHQGLEDKIVLVKCLLDSVVMPSPAAFRDLLRKLSDLSVKGAGDLELHARDLLEHSFFADLRSVVMRALQGRDSGSEDPQEYDAAAVQALKTELSKDSLRVNSGNQAPSTSGRLSVPDTLLEEDEEQEGPVGRTATMMEGVYRGLQSVIGNKAPKLQRMYSISKSMARASTMSRGLMAAARAPGDLAESVKDKVEKLVHVPAAIEDALASILIDPTVDDDVQALATGCLIKRLFSAFLLNEPSFKRLEDGTLIAWFLYDYPSLSNTPRPSQEVGVVLLLRDPKALESSLEAFFDLLKGLNLKDMPVSGQIYIADDIAPELPRDILDSEYYSLVDKDLGSMMGREKRCCELMENRTAQTKSNNVRAVTVAINAGSIVPLRVGFSTSDAEPAYTRRRFLRQMPHISSVYLELHKFDKYPLMRYRPTRSLQWHTYSCTDTNQLQRLFVRGLVRNLNFSLACQDNDEVVVEEASKELERVLGECLLDLDQTMAKSMQDYRNDRPDWIHLFMTVIPHLPFSDDYNAQRLATLLKTGIAQMMGRHMEHVRAIGVMCLEIRLRMPNRRPCWRVVINMPTGHETGEKHVQVYTEELVTEGLPTNCQVLQAEDKLVYKILAGDDLPGLSGKRILDPYPALEPLQTRRLNARKFATTYCYDFPSVFANSLKDIWAEYAAYGDPKNHLPAGELVTWQELALESPSPTCYRESGKLVKVDRPPGTNKCGMVAWLLTLKTPEYPKGREVMAIANDITYQSGAFGPVEDGVFRAATELALQMQIPIVYLAANSGARVGLSTEVREALKVAWSDPDNPANGFDYLYLEEQDYQRFKAGSAEIMRAERRVVDDQVQYVLTDVIGAEDGLGVECLSGSGAIASAYNRAFREGYTVTLVSGRTVGIGAYLARLGRRCIQRADQPIILTGYAALNKLLGRQVYTSQMQLGGPMVMGVNGVAHHVVPDDVAGVKTMLRLLSYAPIHPGSPTCALSVMPTADPVNRHVTYLPGENEKLDPRAAIAGRDVNGVYQSGLFDKGSWIESQVGWARTVVTGRARLAGVPCGVIAVETQMVNRNIPADPGMDSSSELNIMQAGQVWYPDSADKTAQAMEEFNLEGLPLFILANWRGFSGGQKDLFDGVLQMGSLIVEQLRTYKQPVFVYLPCGAELRGGAWVVIDSQINASHLEMYADPNARGAVLEPEGVCEIKFRQPEMIKLMHKIDPVILAHKAAGGGPVDPEVKAREKLLLPVYTQVARAYADMHDRPARMMAKGVLTGVVPWHQSRKFFVHRLERRLLEHSWAQKVNDIDLGYTTSEIKAMVRSWDKHTPVVAPPHMDPATTFAAQMADDQAFLTWAKSSAGQSAVGAELTKLRGRAAGSALRKALKTTDGRDGLLKELQALVQEDRSLALQLRVLLGGSS